MSLSTMFPPLYQCSKCERAVRVIPQGEGVEPIKKFNCTHTDAPIWANRKVTLYGKGVLEGKPLITRGTIKLTMTIRQLLSWLTNRSI